MMGERQSGQDGLFYGFSLENRVPNHHMLWAIDTFADLGFVREHLKGYYSHSGRSSVDPELMTFAACPILFGIRAWAALSCYCPFSNITLSSADESRQSMPVTASIPI